VTGRRAVEAKARDELEAPRAAGVTGLVFAALLTASLLIFHRHPGPGSPPAEIAEWYRREAGSIGLAGIYLMPFAGIAFLWFTAVLRHNVVAAHDRFFDTVFLGSALLFVAMLFAATAAAASLLASVKFLGAAAPSPDAVGVVRALAYTLFYVYALRAAAVFMIVSSTIALRRGALPRWLVVAGYVLALVLLLSVSYVSLLALVFPAWVTAVSIVILRGTRAPEPM
jgi:hypothetical protein